MNLSSQKTVHGNISELLQFVDLAVQSRGLIHLLPARMPGVATLAISDMDILNDTGFANLGADLSLMYRQAFAHAIATRRKDSLTGDRFAKYINTYVKAFRGDMSME